MYPVKPETLRLANALGMSATALQLMFDADSVVEERPVKLRPCKTAKCRNHPAKGKQYCADCRRQCVTCDGKLPANSRSTRKYCSSACRQSSYRNESGADWDEL